MILFLNWVRKLIKDITEETYLSFTLKIGSKGSNPYATNATYYIFQKK
jgi:hypothetical protein